MEKLLIICFVIIGLVVNGQDIQDELDEAEEMLEQQQEILDEIYIEEEYEDTTTFRGYMKNLWQKIDEARPAVIIPRKEE